jgi:DNA primase
LAGRIRDEDIAAVRERSPIDEVVGEYLQLRNAGGGSLKGLCPFHDEKTPSFNVTPSRGLFYCLAGDTRVLTWGGVRPIRELAGGTHRILARSGNWVDAPFFSFGVQPLLRLTISRNGVRKDIYATPEHRWFVRSGKTQSSEREVLTKDLKPRHRLVSKFPRARIKRTTPSPFGIAHGLTFGDGTRSGSGSMAQLDAVKDTELIKWFPLSLVTQYGRQLLVHHLPRFFKELPRLDESVSYLYGWLAGYFAADGCVSDTGMVMLNCADRGHLEHVRAVCTRLGIGTYGITEQVRCGFPGREPSSIFRIILINSDLTDDFFLLNHHRLRFASIKRAFERRGWVVQEVAQTERVEEVFCAVVNEGHAFVLEDNILTGNCFSCAEGGDVISFVQKVDNLSFAEAVERLAARAGIELRYEQGGHVPGQEQSLRRRLIAAHRAAAEFYSERLRSADAVAGRDFLASRGFDLEQADSFGVGYAPDSWEALTGHLRGRGFTDAELLTGGLARDGRRGPVDRFRGRLIWPIRDLTGDVIAFGARRLAERDDGPKYLNTPETPLFRKSTVLYGADMARREIAQRRQAVIVEGYTDVMACHLAGVKTAVATSGTSFGDGHIRILRRLLMDASEFRGEVIFTFDGDAAGQRAALRAFGMEDRFVTQTFVTVQPDGLDPCDLRLARGDAAVRDLIARRVPLFEFAIRSEVNRFDLETIEGRLAALDAAAPIVGRIKDEGLRKRYAISLDRWLGLMDESFVLDRVRAHGGPDRARASRQAPPDGPGPSGGRPAAGARGAPGTPADRRARGNGGRPAAGPAESAGDGRGAAYDPRDPVVRVEREALKLAVQRPGLCGPGFAALGADAFTVPAHAEVFRLICEHSGWDGEGQPGAAGTGPAAGGASRARAGQSGREWARELLEAATDEQSRALVTQLAVEPLRTPGADGEPDARYVSAVLARVEELAVSRLISGVKSRLQRMDPVEAQATYNRLFGDLIGLEQRRKVLIDRASGAL